MGLGWLLSVLTRAAADIFDSRRAFRSVWGGGLGAERGWMLLEEDVVRGSVVRKTDVRGSVEVLYV